MAKLTNEQQNIANQIYRYGVENNFTHYQIQIALNVAFIESSLGLQLSKPDSTASGLYQYTNGTWTNYHSALGEKDNIGNQITAFYNDLSTYNNWYNNPATNGNIPEDLNFDEYVYIKHHDGRGYTDFENAPGLEIYRNITSPGEIDIESHQEPYRGSLAVNAEIFVGGGKIDEYDTVGCIKIDSEGTVYIDYFLEPYLTDAQRQGIVDADPVGAFYIY
ncbi:hypothetical protein KOE80_04725 [Alcaligenes sp. 13f]|uniref:hypothetical protein n=1 Tax=Alcaligenes sp. 13f TaxID=2841924 RepID=UPI001CF66E58|nr:hypothetical protein [Alcaligenes sp. 13f]MCB4321507.1 hypothetical protein [Alcaligenes sp. 13f]